MGLNSDKIILDLCGGTGSWSKQYKKAGYNVKVITLPEYDVCTYIPPKNVYGILAAPPCTMFSLARTNAKVPRNLRLGIETVEACYRIIWECQYKLKNPNQHKTDLKFWALENPKGFLNMFLGIPALTFNPYDYGDRYMKATCIWGNFNIPKKNPIILTKEERGKFDHRLMEDLPALPEGYILPPNYDKRAAMRAITPPGFAKAFFKANQ